MTTHLNFEEARELPEGLIEDILSVVTTKSVLFRDLINCLRRNMQANFFLPSERRWNNINEQRLEASLREWGFFFRFRTHGAGLAVYIFTESFDTVIDRFGKTVPVREW